MLGDRLKELRESNHYKTKEVAELVGITLPTYLNYEKNISKPKIDVLVGLAGLYDVSLYYLLEQDESDPIYAEYLRQHSKHAYTTIPKGESIVLNTYKKYRHDVPETSLELSDQIIYPKWWNTQGDRYISIKIADNDMSPELFKGDTVIIKKQKRLKQGDLVLLQKDKDYAVVRKCVQKRDQTFFIAQNPSCKYNALQFLEEVKVVGVVVEVRRTLQDMNQKKIKAILAFWRD